MEDEENLLIDFKEIELEEIQNLYQKEQLTELFFNESGAVSSKQDELYKYRIFQIYEILILEKFRRESLGFNFFEKYTYSENCRTCGSLEKVHNIAFEHYCENCIDKKEDRAINFRKFNLLNSYEEFSINTNLKLDSKQEKRITKILGVEWEYHISLEAENWILLFMPTFGDRGIIVEKSKDSAFSVDRGFGILSLDLRRYEKDR